MTHTVTPLSPHVNFNNSLNDIRQGIDHVDKQIISLISERYEYVKAVTAFKHNAEEVIAQERYDSVLVTRAKLADSYGIEPDMVVNLWTTMMDWFIEQELKMIEGKEPYPAPDDKDHGV